MAKRQVVAPDTGEPGKFYFTPPITCNVSLESKQAPPNPVEKKGWPYPESKGPVNLDSYRERTNCRLLSSKNGYNQNPPKEIKYLLSPHPTQQEIRDYHEIKSVEGFGEGAIVARRWGPKGDHKWAAKWGMIMICHKVERGGVASWSPYAVKWFMVGEIEQAWAEDLIVIHQALDHTQLDAIAEAQGVEV